MSVNIAVVKKYKRGSLDSNGSAERDRFHIMDGEKQKGKETNLRRSEKDSRRNIVYVYAGKSYSFSPSGTYCNKLWGMADKT